LIRNPSMGRKKEQGPGWVGTSTVEDGEKKGNGSGGCEHLEPQKVQTEPGGGKFKTRRRRGGKVGVKNTLGGSNMDH